jgi:hypothetical protein
MSSASAPPSGAPRVSTAAEVVAWFRQRGKAVVTFIGFSSAGYQDFGRVRGLVEAELQQFDAARTIVNAGATAEGIGAVYPIAKRHGFETTGIVSSQAMASQSALSPAVDRVFFVADPSWGGFLPDSEELSPTSQAMVEVSDWLIAIGGGAVARDELIAAQRAGKSIRFIPADMNHVAQIRKALEAGSAPPSEFSGEAYQVFGRARA